LDLRGFEREMLVMEGVVKIERVKLEHGKRRRAGE
jgi:hypothetical protein